MEEQPNKNLENPTIVSMGKPASTNNRTLVMSIGAGILIIILIFVFWPRHNSKTVFTIDGTAYNQSYILPLASFPIKQLGEPANNEYKLLLNMLEYKTVAAKLGITPDSDQINTQQATLNQEYSGYSTLTTYKTWSGLVSLDLAIQNELSTQYSDGYYQGYSYIFWFGNTVEVGPAYTNPNAGNQSIYSNDKTYALNQAHYYYSQLTANKMTAAQVYSAVSINPQLEVNSTSNTSVHFGTNNSISWIDQVYYQDVINYVSSQHKTGLSAIRTGTITVKNPTVTKPNAYYYIVKIDRIGTSATIFKQDLNLLKVKYYGVS
jgi:hypothetical protein